MRFCVLILGVLTIAVPASAIEPPDAYKPRLPAEPLYLPDQVLRIAEPDSGTVLIPPDRITVYFRTFEFDLVPGSLELWVDGVEKTEELEFADDRAWWEVPDPDSWSPGDHEIEADITDASGLRHQAFLFFIYFPIPLGYFWPFAPTNQPNVVANLMEDWQDFGYPPYWHHGFDIREDAGSAVYSTTSGTVVKKVNYSSGNLYWNVSVQDLNGFIWQYHHMDPATITVNEGNGVTAGDLLGYILPWPSSMNQATYNHLHMNVVEWKGQGPVPEPYVDGFEYHNPFLFLTHGTYQDTIPPQYFDVWFMDNEDTVAFAADGDPGMPVLSGDVDFSVRIHDYMNTIGSIGGQPFELGIYEIGYRLEAPVDCPWSWRPLTILARFDKIPGGTTLNTQGVLLNAIYKDFFEYGIFDYGTGYNYAFQVFYYVPSNAFYGTVDAQNGYWNTDNLIFYGPQFPDGVYKLFIHAKDYYGNVTETLVEVELDNGLSPVNCYYTYIQSLNISGSIQLQKLSGESSSMIPGTLPVAFGPITEGSAWASIAGSDFTPWVWDFPSDGTRVILSVPAGEEVEVEYVPYLGDVILEIPAEVRIESLTGGSVGTSLDVVFPAADHIDGVLRLSTRLSRDPSTGEARLGRPLRLGELSFGLTLARSIDVEGEEMLFTSEEDGSEANFVLDPALDVNPPEPQPPSRLQFRAFPNPFRSRLSVRVMIPSEDDVVVDVMDVSGRQVARLHEGVLPAGEHTFSWNGRTGSGVEAPAGIYFATARQDGYTVVQKVVRVR